MKRRGIVDNVTDPQQWGRIRVRLFGFDETGNLTPWCWPCSPFAGPAYGFYCLPVVGDEVWVEQSADGDWVWVGFFWDGRKPKPAAGSDTVRIFRTPIGHQVKLDEAGDIEFLHSNGSVITMRANGDIEVTAKARILLNDGGSTRCVNTDSICSYTGLPHPQGSRTVFSEKP